MGTHSSNHLTRPKRKHPNGAFTPYRLTLRMRNVWIYGRHTHSTQRYRDKVQNWDLLNNQYTINTMSYVDKNTKYVRETSKMYPWKAMVTVCIDGQITARMISLVVWYEQSRLHVYMYHNHHWATWNTSFSTSSQAKVWQLRQGYVLHTCSTWCYT